MKPVKEIKFQNSYEATYLSDIDTFRKVMINTGVKSIYMSTGKLSVFHIDKDKGLLEQKAMDFINGKPIRVYIHTGGEINLENVSEEAIESRLKEFADEFRDILRSDKTMEQRISSNFSSLEKYL